jgi:predicted anti-sigma-YlaC factor YlaD
MDCQHTQEHLFAYHENGVDEKKRGEIDAHLALCPACSALSQQILMLGKHIADAREERPGPFLSTRIMQRLENEFFCTDRRMVARWQAWLRPAAITLALAAGITIGNITAKRSAVKAEIAIEVNDYEALRDSFYIADLLDEDHTVIFNNEQP